MKFMINALKFRLQRSLELIYLGIESLWYYGSIDTDEIWQQVGTVTG